MSSETTVRESLASVLAGDNLPEPIANETMRALTDPALPTALVAGLLTALRMKGETADEVRGFARAMRELARRPEITGRNTIVDCVGTGGDGSGSVNLSTGSALLAAACGLDVVKHGNRSVSSKSGSADVLEELGLALPLAERPAGACLDATGFTFLFAPHYHPAMKALVPVRQAMKIRTVFNLLGPLTNPAEPPYLLLGAYTPEAAQLMAETLAGMNVERAFVVHGEPGWDEATPVGPFLLFDVMNGTVTSETRDPREYGLARCAPEDLQGGDAAANASALRRAFAGDETETAHRDALALGAGLMLELTGRADDLARGISIARDAIASGAATAIIEKIAKFQPETA